MAMQVAQLGVLVVLSRTSGTESVGLYITAVAVCTPLVLFANLQLNVDIAARSESSIRFNDYLLLRIISVCGTLAAITVICVIIFGWVPMTQTLSGLALLKGAESLCDLCGAWQLKRQKSPIFARSLIARSLTLLILYASVYPYIEDIGFTCACIACVWLGIFLLHDLPNVRCDASSNSIVASSNPKVGKRLSRLFAIAARTVPLGIVSLVGSLELSMPKYAAACFLEIGPAGVLGTAMALTLGGQIAVAALLQTRLPTLAEHYRLGRKKEYLCEQNTLVRLSSLIGAAQAALITIFGPAIQSIAFGPDAVSTRGVLLSVSLGSSLLAIGAVFAAALRSRGHYWYSLIGQAASLGCAAVSTIVFATFGALGIAIAMPVFGGLSILIFTLLTKHVSLAPSMVCPPDSSPQEPQQLAA